MYIRSIVVLMSRDFPGDFLMELFSWKFLGPSYEYLEFLRVVLPLLSLVLPYKGGTSLV